MRHRLSKFWLLLVAILGISLSVGAVTDEINRIAEQADKLYVQGHYYEAFRLMKLAAEGGDVISMFTLGTMYYEGQGTATNEREARRWWQEAANHGDTMAIDCLKRLDEKRNSTQAVANVRTKTFTANGVSFTMVEVEGGTFTMGTTLEQSLDVGRDGMPAHQVTLSDFCIGQTEVTQLLWQAVMGKNPSRFTFEEQCPVEQVSWDDCQKFIKKLNKLTGQKFRLPTEAEWEYAARGGKSSHGYKYSGSNTLDDVAWYRDNSGLHTHSVGTKAPNELGLYDMSGNVWEWCSDWYGSYSSDAQTNPTGPASGSRRVYRGGCYFGMTSACYMLYRLGTMSNLRDDSTGLRLAL